MGGGELLEFGAVAPGGAKLFLAVARQHNRTFFRYRPPDERNRRRRHVALDDLVDETVPQRVLRRYRIAREDHAERRLDADEARQALGAAGARNDAELDFRQAKARARRRDAKMAAECELETAAERGTVQRRKDRFGAGLDCFDHCDGGRLARRLAEFRNVGAGYEGAPGASDHNGGDVGITRRPRYPVEEPDPDLVFHGIDRRIVDGDDGDTAISSHAHEFRHARRSPVLANAEPSGSAGKLHFLCCGAVGWLNGSETHGPPCRVALRRYRLPVRQRTPLRLPRRREEKSHQAAFSTCRN